jgi:hypothetical protein
MSNERSDQTLADYVVTALSPALIMALVGSLVFFLLEVLYSGKYEGRMQWILFFFVFGIVLIARISMMAEAARAPLYGLVLALLTWLGLQAFVDYPADSPLAPFSWAINLGLIGIIWWCAHRLTWDCTFIDEQADAGSAGLIQASGLQKPEAGPGQEQQAAPKKGKKKGTPGWFERYQHYREEKKKRRTPGVWVVYFSLAALPLFGLGQSLIPVEDEDRRRYVFWLMGIYVASGLGLLLTTCFLGLRRYLRQRKLQMPAAMTGAWLTLGGGLIAALLVLGAVLPRPQTEYPLIDLGPLGSKNRSASRFAVKNDSPGKDSGQPGSSNRDQKDGMEGQKDKKGEGAKDGKNVQGDRGNKDAATDKKDSSGGEKDKSSSGKNDRSGRDRAGNQPGEQRRDRAEADSKGDQSGKAKKPDEAQKQQSGSSSSSSNGSWRDMLSKLGRVGSVLKWIVFGILALFVLFFLLRAGLQFLANFTNWAKQLLDAWRAFWERLFGAGRKDAQGGGDSGDGEVAPARPRPFVSFHNPFVDGSAENFPPDEVVRYTFMALQSWAWERGLGRQPQETPLEFAARIGIEVPGLEADARRLAALYARAVYARGSLPADSLAAVRQFWERLEAVAEQPLSV